MDTEHAAATAHLPGRCTQLDVPACCAGHTCIQLGACAGKATKKQRNGSDDSDAFEDESSEDSPSESEPSSESESESVSGSSDDGSEDTVSMS